MRSAVMTFLTLLLVALSYGADARPMDDPLQAGSRHLLGSTYPLSYCTSQPAKYEICNTKCVKKSEFYKESVANCGKCNNDCRTVNGPLPTGVKAACKDSKCAYEGCGDGKTFCSGACVPKLNNCGACGIDCLVSLAPIPANAQPKCDSGQCKIECDDGYEYCDGTCVLESEFNTVTNCGACGNACTTARDGAQATCIPEVETEDDDEDDPDRRRRRGLLSDDDFVCSDECIPGEYCPVAGACLPVTDNNAAYCGASCTDCTASTPTGTTASCSAGVCSYECISGEYCPVGDACLPVADDNASYCGSSCTDCTASTPTGTTASCSAGVCSYA